MDFLRRKYFAAELLLRPLPAENRAPLDFIKYSKFGGGLQGENRLSEPEFIELQEFLPAKANSENS